MALRRWYVRTADVSRRWFPSLISGCTWPQSSDDSMLWRVRIAAGAICAGAELASDVSLSVAVLTLIAGLGSDEPRQQRALGFVVDKNDDAMIRT